MSLVEANLDNTNFYGTNASHSDFRRASFVGAMLYGSDFRDANLVGANTSWHNTNSDFGGARF